MPAQRVNDPLLIGPGFWRGEPAPLLARLGARRPASPAAEAASRLARLGPNLLHPRAGAPSCCSSCPGSRTRCCHPADRAPRRSPALTGDVASFVIIVAIVLLSVTLDFVQEYRAGQAAERLRQSVAVRVTARARRQAGRRPGARARPRRRRAARGRATSSPPTARLLEARDLLRQPGAADRRALSGREAPGGGTSGSAADAALRRGGQRRLHGHLGGQRHGAGAGLRAPARTRRWARSASRSSRQAAADRLRARHPELRPPDPAADRAAGAVRAPGQRRSATAPLLESFLFAVALAVGLTPELLPMVVSVTLARGALRMAARSVIVKRLAAIHDLGSMDVLCTDKTGTLTEARIRLERTSTRPARDSARVLELAYLNSRFETGLRSPLDEAILAPRRGRTSPAGTQARRGALRLRAAPRLGAGPARRRRAGCWSSRARPRTSCAVCHHVRGGTARTTCRAARRRGARGARPAASTASAREGFRVLGVAWRDDARRLRARRRSADERELVFAGFAAFVDPPKASAARGPARRWPRSGVAVKVVTGDNELVTRTSAAQLRLPVAGVLTGHEIEAMGDDALAARGPASVTLFCRVTPAAEEPHHPRAQAPRARRRLSSATASTTRRRCTRPTSASRSRAASTWRRRRPTSSCSSRTSRCSTTASSRGGAPSATS